VLLLVLPFLHFSIILILDFMENLSRQIEEFKEKIPPLRDCL
jgi:hypothetical protein